MSDRTDRRFDVLIVGGGQAGQNTAELTERRSCHAAERCSRSHVPAVNCTDAAVEARKQAQRSQLTLRAAGVWERSAADG